MDCKLQELERIAKTTLSEDNIAAWGHFIRRTFGEKPPKKDLEVQYDLAHRTYVTRNSYWTRSTIVAEENKIFFDCLKFKAMSVRRGGLDVVMQSILDEKTYFFGAKEFGKIINIMINGIVCGWFTFTKRGSSTKLAVDSIVRLR